MAIRNARSEFRDVNITFDDGSEAQLDAPIDSFKAAINKVEEIEGQFAKLGSFTDLDGATVIVTGTNPNKVYVFDLTTTIADAGYEFVFIESRPNALDEA